MTLKEEFQKQWEGLCNSLHSEMIKAKDADMGLDRISSCLEREKRNWFLPGQYRNAWFEKLKQTDPEIAEKFEKALKSIKIQVGQFKPGVPVVKAALIMCVGLALGFGVSKIFAAKLIATIVLTITGGALGYSVIMYIYNKNKEEAFKKVCSAYLNELKKEGESLALIVSEAD